MYLVRVNQYLSLPLSSAASHLVSLPSRLPPTASAFPSLPRPRPRLREPTTEPLWPNAVRVSRILYFTTPLGVFWVCFGTLRVFLSQTVSRLSPAHLVSMFDFALLYVSESRTEGGSYRMLAQIHFVPS
jgi:hypothetical protein